MSDIFLNHSPPSFLRQFLTELEACLASQPAPETFLSPPALGLQACCHAQLLIWVLGVELGSSCLQDFTD